MATVTAAVAQAGFSAGEGAYYLDPPPSQGGSSAPTFAGGAGDIYYANDDGGFGGGGGGGSGEGCGGGGGGYSGGGGGSLYGGGGGGGGSYEDASITNLTTAVTATGNGYFLIYLPQSTLVVTQATPTLATTPQPASAPVNTPIADKATVSGGYNPTGTVTFNLYNNSSGTGTPLFTDTETLSGGTATSASYTPTAIGTDYWVVTYNGDGNNISITSAAASEPVTVTNGVVPTLVGSPVINGDNPNGLLTAAGQGATLGVQRSMVEDVVYTFSVPVTIPNASTAFTVVGAGAHPGIAPTTLSATAVPGSNGTQWAVTLTGKAAGVLASIANGEYSITINPAGVFSAADGTTQLAAGRTDQFYRLYGDINAKEVVNALDNLALKKAIGTYNPAFDSNGDGAVNALDNLAFKKDLIIAFFGDGFVPTI